MATKTNQLTGGTKTNKDLCIAHSSDEQFIIFRTPEGKTISLSDATIDLQDDKDKSVLKTDAAEIRLQFDENTMIILNKDGITLKGKEIKIESADGKTVKVNQSEFKA